MSVRLLKANEIECRVQSMKANGCILLLYKDARTDMRILDETYGEHGWQRTHELINGQLFCNIDLWDDIKNQWVRKQDVGIESNTEKEKGQASDAFKRAGFNVGIGRELYTSPFIWINLDATEVTGTSPKLKLSYKVKFFVKEIEYDKDREITKVVIVDQTGKIRFPTGYTKPPEKDIPSDLITRARKIYITMTKVNKLTKEQYNEWCKGYKKMGRITTDYGKEWTLADVEFLEIEAKNYTDDSPFV